MLGRAIQDHHPSLPGLKGTTLSQHYQANAKGNALKPVPATALNATIPSWSHSSNPLKRTASQASGHESLYGSQEQAPRKKAAIDLTQTSVVGGRVGKLHDIVSFDENDFDDDADIDLDEEVSPSVSKGFPTQSLSTLGPELFETDSSRTLLADSNQEKPATPRTTASSTALPWSSSPLSHVQARPPTKAATTEAPAAKAPQRRTLPWLEDSGEQVEGSAQSSPTDHVPDDLRAEIQQYAAKDAASGARGKTAGKKAIPDFVRKKLQQAKDAKAAQTDGCERFMASEAPVKFKSQRGIPKFVQKKMQQAQDGKAARAAAGEPFKSKRDIPDFVQKKMQQAQDGKATRAVGDGQFTPLPNDKGSSKFPWNTTASAVKEQQKQLRQGHRKLIKDHEGGEVAKSNSKKRKEAVNKVFLSNEQKSVLDLVVDKNKSVFFTGSAGTGKSVLLREIIQVLRSRYNRETDRVAVTASTGLAACNVGGVTLHSFAGIGLGKEAVPELVRKIKKNPKARHRWMRTKILVVDEISMVDGDLFDKLESIARAMRNNGRPFGGIQLVITGDFFQLPPVPDYGRVSKFSFDAATWNTSVEHTIGLTQVFRQKDPVFANMLNEMRLGKLTSNSINAFRALNRPLSFSDDFEATELFPTRNEVDNANNARMRNLVGKEFEFKAVDGGTIQNLEQRSKLLANCMAPPAISLKKGAQVMLIKNLDDTLVNGSVGKVIAFMDEKTFEYYHEDEDEFQAVETMDLDDAEMTSSRMKLKQKIAKNLAGDTSQNWPVVRFTIPDGTFRDLLCQREPWLIELPNGEIQASRSQIPLILAWALSIHKAQGQTLDRVKVDLGKIFEKGQAYVALSRATCQEGLQISRFDPKKVMAHDRVRTFYESLYSVNETADSKVAVEGPKKAMAAKDYENSFVDSVFDEDDDAMRAMYGQ